MGILPLTLTDRPTCTPHGSSYVLNLSPPLQNIVGFHGDKKALAGRAAEISSQDVQNYLAIYFLRPDVKEKQ